MVRTGGSRLACASRAGAAAAFLAFGSPSVAHAQACADTGLDVDCDNDTVTLADGDCDDENPDVHPFAKEECKDQLDNDCDGLFDEDCDKAIHHGTIGGGGGCTAESNIDGTEAMLFLPLLPLLIVAARRGGTR